MKTRLIIIGGFTEIIDLCEDNDIEIVGLIDSKSYQRNKLPYKIIGVDNDADVIFRNFPNIPLIISPDKPKTRQTIYSHYDKYGFSFYTLSSRRSYISKSASIGLGTIIQSGANISSEVKIGSFVKINSCANIMHNCEIGDFTTVAPNAVVLGRVKVGTLCYIGANSTILPNVEICDNTTIGAGAVVTKSIYNKGQTFIGIPAKSLSR